MLVLLTAIVTPKERMEISLNTLVLIAFTEDNPYRNEKGHCDTIVVIECSISLISLRI
jgi:hypothetical protein